MIKRLVAGAVLVPGLLLLSFIAHPKAQAAEPYRLTLCGASPGGLWSLLGAGIDAAVKAAYPDSTVTYQTSGGGFANVGLLRANKCDLAIVHDVEAQYALKGQAPFKAPADDLRAIAVMYNWAPMQIVINKDFAENHGITSVEDIIAKKAPIRISVNKKGLVVNQVIETMFKAAGASYDDVEAWGGKIVYAASKEMSRLIRDRRLDAMGNATFVGHRAIRQAGEAVDLKLLGFSGPVINATVDALKVERFTIPGGSYPWAPEDINTITLAAQLVALDRLDKTIAQNITQALVDHVDKVAGVHKAMKALTPAIMASSQSTPYHAGARAAFKASNLR